VTDVGRPETVTRGIETGVALNSGLRRGTRDLVQTDRPRGRVAPMGIEDDKRAAAVAAAQQVTDGMVVGLGTGSTVAYLIPALASRTVDARYVATSPATETAARRAGLRVLAFEGVVSLDLAIDGADQVAPARWLVKGGGGAHTREKIVATAADRFVVIVSANKLVDRLGPPVPLELLEFGIDSTLRRVGALGPVRRRAVPPSPDGGVIADLFAPVGDPDALAQELDGVAGVIAHGLFPPALVSEVIVGRDGEASTASSGRPSSGRSGGE
jgi:ribose 5-phosphate isomerase A